MDRGSSQGFGYPLLAAVRWRQKRGMRMNGDREGMEGSRELEQYGRIESIRLASHEPPLPERTLTAALICPRRTP
ncbi:hypothetical protein DPX16_17627 [Anabarilius grahami]|uniref:Uncharacterized protein n=1 Tax=Anabarilius grahami TaxID=495550 RepID=A0A3N0YI14_ANAGA|nr:hypothetical protein DPX16_17627 [Anabarilius grahami]